MTHLEIHILESFDHDGSQDKSYEDNILRKSNRIMK